MSEVLWKYRPRRRGFTLIELMVTLALLSVLTVMMVSMTNSTGAVWHSTTAKIEQFRGADTAFETITRRLSQATLNTYWGYDNSNAPKKYQRQADLRFVTGNTQTLLKTHTPRRPLHAVFFQAPLGWVDDTTNFDSLDNLINTCGYYVEFNDDKASRPDFINSMSAPPATRWRYRLMELTQPSNSLSVYSFTSGQPTYKGYDWFARALTQSNPPTRALAENIIALVLQPKLSKADQATTNKTLSKDYSYDTTNPTAITDPDINPTSQLPPLVQTTIVAIDETSAARLDKGSTPPPFDSTLDNLFVKTEDFDADLVTLQNVLSSAKPPINYRVFTTSVSIRGAKWSRK